MRARIQVTVFTLMAAAMLAGALMTWAHAGHLTWAVIL